MAQQNMFEHLGKVVDALISEEGSDITRFFKSMFTDSDAKSGTPQSGCCGGSCVGSKSQPATEKSEGASSDALNLIHRLDSSFQAMATKNGVKVSVSRPVYNAVFQLATVEDNQEAKQLLMSDILEISESC